MAGDLSPISGIPWPVPPMQSPYLLKSCFSA